MHFIMHGLTMLLVYSMCVLLQLQYSFTVNWFLVKFKVNVYMEAHRLMSLPSLAAVLLARCSGVSIKGTVLSVSALFHLVCCRSMCL